MKSYPGPNKALFPVDLIRYPFFNERPKRTLLDVAWRGKPKVIENANFQSEELAAWILDRDPQVSLAALTFVHRQEFHSSEILAAINNVFLKSRNPEIKAKAEKARQALIEASRKN